MRRRIGLKIEELGRKSRLSHNVVSRLERDETRKANPWVFGRILPPLADAFKEAFPETHGDPYDFLIPPVSFGSSLKNLRLRRGLQLKELAKALQVRPYTVIRYERDETKPTPSVREKLRELFAFDSELDRFLSKNQDGNPQGGNR